jgi:hypothetical protein
MTKLCDLEITPEVERVFTDAVKEHYWYQMYIGERRSVETLSALQTNCLCGGWWAST